MPADQNEKAGSKDPNNESFESVLINLVRSTLSPHVFIGFIGDWISGFFEKPDPGAEKAEWWRRVWLVGVGVTIVLLIAIAIFSLLFHPLAALRPK